MPGHCVKKTYIKYSELLGYGRIEHCLPELSRIQAIQHDKNVAWNLRGVGSLIDVVCYLELAFRCHKENEMFLNKGNCLEFLSLRCV